MQDYFNKIYLPRYSLQKYKNIEKKIYIRKNNI